VVEHDDARPHRGDGEVLMLRRNIDPRRPASAPQRARRGPAARGERPVLRPAIPF